MKRLLLIVALFICTCSLKVAAQAPNLPVKGSLSQSILSTRTFSNSTQTDTVIRYRPTLGNYTLEVVGKVNSATGRGLDIDTRNATGKGVRLSLDTSALKVSSSLSAITNLSAAQAGQNQTIRIAVKSDSAYIYHNGAYIQTQPLSTINDIVNGAETAGIQATIPGPNLIPTWLGAAGNYTGKPSDYGWTLSGTTTTLFNTANSTSGSRYVDVNTTSNTHTYNGTTYNGRVLYIRWDGSSISNAVYTLPVTLEANTTYYFSMLHAYAANATGTKSITVGIGKTTNVTDRFASQVFNPNGTLNLQRDYFAFTSQEAGTYYLTFTGTWGLYSIGELSLNKNIASSLIPNWAGIAPNNSGTPGAYSWAYTGTTTNLFNTANGSSGVRYMDVSASSGSNVHTYNGSTYTGRLMYIRWDGSSVSSMVYNYPVMLEANTTYNFSMLRAYISNATGNKTITVGIGKTTATADRFSSHVFVTSGTKVLNQESFSFTSQAAGLYYLTFTGDWALFSIGELSLTKININPRFIFGKDYPSGNVDMSISSVSYDDGAYAPSGINTAPIQNLVVTGKTASFLPTSNTNFIVPGKTDLHLTGAFSPLINSTVQLNSNDSWLFFDNIKPSAVIANWLNSVYINGVSAANNPNLRISVYKNGTVIIPNGNITSSQALQVYTGTNLSGASTSYEIETYHDSLGTFNNAIRSFKLKRGYMATLANNPDGSGYSRVFIANDDDLTVNTMPAGLDTTVSFIRVFKWDWVSKKGKAGWSPAQVGATWYYDWNIGGSESTDYNYSIIRQNGGWPSWTDIHNKQNVNHLLGFNEPDQANQSNLTVAQAVQEWPEMMKSGLRIGSPAPANPEGSWITNFLAKTDSLNLRVDFVAIHCYWGGQTPQQWYSRLKNIYNRVKRPLWITEWNNGANWTGETWPTDTTQALQKQLSDIKGILNVLDTASFVERYAEYDWVEYKRALVLADTLTPAGKYYYADRSALAYNPAIAPVHNWQLAAPQIYTSINSTDFTKVTLSWLDLNGELGSKYVLERKISGVDSNFVAVKTFTGYPYGSTITYVDSVYPKANYRINAWDLSGTKNTYSGIVTVVRDAQPVAPTSLTGTVLSSSIAKLAWNASTATVRAYNLKRATDPNGPFITVSARTTALAYQDTTLTPNTTYYYVVTSLNSAGESANSAMLTLTTPQLVAPAAVANPRIASGDTKTTLTWNFIYDARYEISRAASKNGPYSVIATNLNGLRYQDTARNNGSTYYYKIVAYNAAGRSTDTLVLAGTPALGQYMHLGFNENTGTFTQDNWGGYNGTIVNAATWTAGKDGSTGALDLVKSASAYVQLANGVGSQLNDFTIAVWVKLPSPVATNTRLFDFGTSTSNFMMFTPNSGSGVRYKITCAKGTNDRFIPYNLPLNQWVHVALTQQGSAFSFYVNGVLQYSDNNATIRPSDLGATTSNFIGKSQYSTDPYSDHTYDDFKIYNRALSQSEINTIMKNDQVITFNAIPAKKFGDADFSPNATSSSGLPVSYTSSDTTVASIVNGMIHINWIGTTTITASQPGNNTFAPAAVVNMPLVITDQTPPVITPFAQPIMLALDSTGVRTIKLSDIATVADNVTKNPKVTISPSVLSCQSTGKPQPIIITATDDSGNSSADTITVTVRDTIAPVVKTRSLTVSLDSTGKASITADQINNGSTDNCSIKAMILDKTTFDCSNVGPNTVTLSVVDASGNTANATAVVNVQDNIAPVVITKNITVYLNGGKATITPAQIDSASRDICGIKTMSLDRSTFDCSSQGNNTVTLTVTDNHNNAATGTAVVTVIGQTPNPSISASRTDNTYTGLDANTIALGYGAQSLTLTATDANDPTGETRYQWSTTQGLSNTAVANPVFTPTQPGIYTLVVTAISKYGCQASQSIVIKVIDARCGTKANKVAVYHATGSNSNPYTQLCISANAVPAQLTNGGILGEYPGTNPASVVLASAPATAFTDSAKTTNMPKGLLVYPNPLKGLATVVFNLPVSDNNVKLDVYNSLGMLTQHLYAGPANANVDYRFTFDGGTLIPGAYFVRLTTTTGVKTFTVVIAH